MLFLNNVGQSSVPILVGGPSPEKVRIKHQTFAVKSFIYLYYKKKGTHFTTHFTQNCRKKWNAGDYINGSHIHHTYAPFTSASSTKNWLAFVSASGLKCRLYPKAKFWHLHASYINHDNLLKTSTTEMYISTHMINRNRAQQMLYWCEGSTSYMFLIYTKWGIWSMQQDVKLQN